MQRKFWNWRDDDLTVDINRWLSGLIESGLYRGFDPILQASMSLKLNHNTTGALRVDDQENWVQKFGVIATKQGVIVQDDTEIILSIDTTGSSGRKDLIVLNHKYTEIEGGEMAIYSVIKGTATEFPNLPNEETQTIIGYLTLPVNCTALNQTGVIYRRAPQPRFANHAEFIEKRNGFFLTNLDARLNRLINMANPNDDQDAATKYYVDQAILNNIVYATEQQRGIVKLATIADTLAGTDDSKAVTPKKLWEAFDDRIATQTEMNAGLSSDVFATPKTVRNMFATVDRRGVIQIATEAEAKAGSDNSKAITPFTLHKAFPVQPRVVEITDWNIDTAQSKTVAHNLAAGEPDKVVAVNGIILSDDGVTRLSLFEGDINVGDVDVTVTVPTSGTFDAVAYSTAGTRRGWVVIWVKADVQAQPNVLSVSAGNDRSLNNSGNNTFTLDPAITASGSAVASILWEVTAKPTGSTATIANAAAEDTTITVDTLGSYTVRITVTNNDGDTATDEVILTLVEAVNAPPEIVSISYPNILDSTYQDNNGLTLVYAIARQEVSVAATSLSLSNPVWLDNATRENTDNSNNELIERQIIGGTMFQPVSDKVVNLNGEIDAIIGRFPSNTSLVPEFDIVIHENPVGSGTGAVDTVIGTFSAVDGFNNIVFRTHHQMKAGWSYEIQVHLTTFSGTESLSFEATDMHVNYTAAKTYSFDASINATDPDGDALTYSLVEVDYSTAGGFGALVDGSIIDYEILGNVMTIQNLLASKTSDKFYGFKLTADDGNGGTDEEYFSVKVRPLIGTSDPEPDQFSMLLTVDEDSRSTVYRGALTMNPSNDVHKLVAIVTSSTFDVSSLDVLLTMTTSTQNQIYTVGTHTVNDFISSSIDIRLEVQAGAGTINSASVEFKAYDADNNVIGNISKLVSG